MKTRSTFFSVFLTLVMLASLMFQVTPAYAAGETFNLGGLGQTYNYISSAPAMNIATGLTATSAPAGGTIDGAIVIIGSGFQSGDTLAATDSGGVASSYNAANGVLTLTGTADVSVYQTVLGTVKFSTASTNTAARTVTYSLGTALPYSSTSHFFEYVPSSMVTWAAANAAASGRTYFGRTGYLATINDAGENDFAATKIGGAGAWVSGSDVTTEGIWLWMSGPEAGSGIGYTNWNAGEPNDSGNEDYLQFLSGGTGRWNDLNGTGTASVEGYVVEYGGLPGDTPMTIQGSVTVNVSVNTPPVAVADGYTVHAGTLLTASTVLVNDSDANSDPLTAIQVSANPAHASAFTFNANGTFTYTPAAGFAGQDTFTYKANDGTADSNVVTVTINVTNIAPVAHVDTYSTNVGAALDAATVLVNDTDADGDALTAIQVSADPAHASAFTFNADGTFSYTPAAGFSGKDTFTYKANDGTANSNTMIANINVVPTLTLTGSGPATVKPGDQYVYTLAYTVNATTLNTQVAFTLPGHTTFVSNTGGYICTPAAGVVTCDLGTVPADGSFTATVLVDKLKKIGTPLTLATTAYSITATSAVPTDGSTAVTANTLNPFADVLVGNWSLDFVQSIWAYGITSGCLSSPLTYCPDANITRAEMAIYIERGVHGGAFNPGTPALTFTDTSTSFARYWIEALKADGITVGCGGTNYCPDASITRAQMSVFLLRGKYGSAFNPAAPTGTYWLDVPAAYWAAGWTDRLGTDGISIGCGGGNFCPDLFVTRAEMAVFVQRTFGLPMPTP